MSDELELTVNENPGVAQAEEARALEEATEVAAEEVKKLSPEELLALQVLAARSQGGSFKQKLSGVPRLAPKSKLSRSWFNGELVLTSELASKSWEEVHASNNVIRKASRG